MRVADNSNVGKTVRKSGCGMHWTGKSVREEKLYNKIVEERARNTMGVSGSNMSKADDPSPKRIQFGKTFWTTLSSHKVSQQCTSRILSYLATTVKGTEYTPHKFAQLRRWKGIG